MKYQFVHIPKTAGSSLYRLNSSQHNSYQRYLDEDIIAEINKLYAKNFELFNYTKL